MGAERLRNPTYDIFILILSILSVFNLALEIFTGSTNIDQVLYIVDLFLSLIFFLDFLARMRWAESKSRYFWREYGWADLLASLPFSQVKILRLFRIFRALRILRRYTFRQMLTDMARYRASSTLMSVLLLVLFIMEFGALGVVAAEAGQPGANIEDGGDGIWWVLVTITTVGYGDRFPVTETGRLVGMMVLLCGVGVFGAFSGFLANFFLAGKSQSAPSPPLTPSAAASNLQSMRELLAKQQQVHEELTTRLAEMEKREVKNA
jgi:voltage-gated potassium channel